MDNSDIYSTNTGYEVKTDNQIDKNVYYQSQISELERQLKEEKNKNKILAKENVNLRNSINNLYKQIGDIKIYENKIKSLQAQINQKNTPNSRK